MRARGVLAAGLLLGAACLASMATLPGLTRVLLEDSGSGRSIASAVLRDGERVTLDWENSLFRLPVKEVLVARSGRLVLTAVTFGSPDGSSPPPATPARLEELYHTGGPFSVQGLQRPLGRVTFLVGELGRPRVTIGSATFDLAAEVGFGGRVLLSARGVRLYELPDLLAARRGGAATPPRTPPVAP